MPRPCRADRTGAIYRALKRGNARQPVFHKKGDFAAFERVIGEGLEKFSGKFFYLNPVAAGLAAKPEESPHTSCKARVDHVHRLGRVANVQMADEGSLQASEVCSGLEEDLWLVPIEDRRRLDSQREGMLETEHRLGPTICRLSRGVLEYGPLATSRTDI